MANLLITPTLQENIEQVVVKQMFEMILQEIEHTN